MFPPRRWLKSYDFTLYLSRALNEENNDHICSKSTIIASSELSSISKHDHRTDIDEHFDIYQEYAVDISAITTDKDTIDHIKKTVQKRIMERT